MGGDWVPLRTQRPASPQVAVSASYSCLPLVIVASTPGDAKNHKKFEKLVTGLEVCERDG